MDAVYMTIALILYVVGVITGLYISSVKDVNKELEENLNKYEGKSIKRNGN